MTDLSSLKVRFSLDDGKPGMSPAGTASVVPKMAIAHGPIRALTLTAPNRRAPRSRSAGGGFTLVEVVTAAALAAVVLLALQSSVLLASRALPKDGGSRPAADCHTTVQRIGNDLAYATEITKQTATAVAFEVADRDGDGVDDRVSYEWSGASGSPVLRTFNSADAEAASPGLRQFSLDYTLRNDTRTGPTVTTADSLFAAYTATPSMASHYVSNQKLIAQVITPVLPSDAISYSVNRVEFILQIRGTNTGTTIFELRTAENERPGTILAQTSVAESSLTSTMRWTAVSFGGISGLSPGTRLCIVARSATAEESCTMMYQASGAPGSAGIRLASNDGGTTWTAPAGQSINFRLYGACVVPGPVITYQRVIATNVTAVPDGSETAISVRLPLLNQPERAP